MIRDVNIYKIESKCYKDLMFTKAKTYIDISLNQLQMNRVNLIEITDTVLLESIIKRII
jgi:hypothetical protein